MFDTLLKIVEASDVCSLLWLPLILLFIGQKIVAEHPLCTAAGTKAAVAVFVLYVGSRACMAEGIDASRLIAIILRGILAGAFVAAILWIILPIVVVAFRDGRAMAQAFRVSRVPATRERRDADRLSREAALHQEADRSARQHREATQKAEDARRRDDARMRCLVVYDRHSNALASRFPRERLQEYFRQYMPDSSPPEIVEERARTLIALIDEWVAQDKSQQRKEFQTLEELAKFFQKQRDEVARLTYETEVKDSLLTNINIQEEQALRRFLAS